MKAPKTNPTDLLASSVLAHLNAKTGRGFKSYKGSGLVERIREGWTLDDFKAVVDFKAVAWLNDPKMAQYLRPDTLFSAKFEGYLVAAKSGVVNPAGQALRYVTAGDL